jgi:hypothetical protein
MEYREGRAGETTGTARAKEMTLMGLVFDVRTNGNRKRDYATSCTKEPMRDEPG